MLTTENDLYNGLIINPHSIPPFEEFETPLRLLLVEAQTTQKNLVWLTLTREQSQHIALALELGFEFHNCEAHATTLTYRAKSDAYIPVPPSHTVGVGAVVINEKNELLMVRDRIHTSSSLYKFPGGMLELEDSLEEGVIREVLEETGVEAELLKMVSVLNSHPFQFNKSNFYIVFRLKPLTETINIVDVHEIELALWLPLDEFFAHDEISEFQKKLVEKALERDGLEAIAFNEPFKNRKKFVEVYG